MGRNVRSAALVAVSLIFLSSLSAEPAALRGREFLLDPPADRATSFRFLPGGSWRPFDRPLLLTAAPGEERAYALELRDAAGSREVDYLVDRLPPAPPRVDRTPGLYRGDLDVGLGAESGASISYEISGPGRPFGELLPWDAARPLHLLSRAEGLSTWVLVAFATDAAGNRSEAARYVYSLEPPDFPPSPSPKVPEPNLPWVDPSLQLGKPLIEKGDSSLLLSLEAPASGVLVAALGGGGDLANPARWQPLAVEGGRALLRLEGPYGWSGSLSLSLGLLDRGVLRYGPEELSLDLSPLSEPGTLPPPSPPSLLSGAPGSPALLVFPDYDGEILCSVDGGPEVPYAGPLLVSPGQGNLELSYRGRTGDGGLSEVSRLSLPRPALLPDKALLGLEPPLARAQAFVLRPAPGVYLRYELGEGGALPSEVGPASPLLQGELSLDGPASGTKRYAIRYRAYTGPGPEAAAGEEGFARLLVDKEAPEPPRLVQALPPFSRQPCELLLEAGAGDRIMVELDDGGRSPRSLEYRGPISLDAPAGSSRTWTVRAWSLDEAGNSSVRLGPFVCAVDPTGLYIDQGARAGGDGDPERPFASVEAALASARFASPVLHLRSGYRFQGPLRLQGSSLALVGGASLRWLWPDSPDRSVLEFPAPAAGSPSLSIEGGRLELSGIEARFAEGEGEALAARSADLRLADSSLQGSSSRSLSLLSLQGSTLRMEGGLLRLGGRGGGADLYSRDSALSIIDSDLGSSDQPASLTCISATGGSLSIEGSRVAPSAGVGAVGISAEGLSLAADRLLLELTGGAGYRRGAVLARLKGSFLNSHFLTKGQAGTMIELRDAELAFVHDSFVDQGQAPSLVFLARGGNPRLLDDLFVAPGGARLLDTDRSLEAGGIGACAFAGFSSLVAGPRPVAAVAALPPYRGGPAALDLGALSPLRAAPKGGFELLPGSPPVDAGLDSGLAAAASDFSGLPRPSAAGKALPDIGADELQ